MNRKLLITLILLMSISLLGIIGTQFLWIQNAVKIEEKKFDSRINKALQNVVNKLEQEEDIILIHKGLSENITSKADNVEIEDITHFIKEKSNRIKSNIVITSGDSSKKGKTKIITSDTLIHLDTPHLKFVGNILPKINIDSLKNLKFNISASDTIFQLKRKVDQIHNIVNKVIIEYQLQDKKIEDRINSEEINNNITAALNDHGIYTSYAYGVLDDASGKVVLTSDSTLNKDLQSSEYKIKLFPTDILSQPNYLSLFIPNRRNMVYRSLKPMLLLSGIFTLFILFTFIITLLFILRQKRISEIKSDFINNITHEFKTPIATIGLAADSIANPKVIGTPERIRYFTNLIKDENYRMNKQVENILQLSLLDKKKLDLNPQLTHINELMQKAAEHMQLQVDEKKGELYCHWQAINDLAEVDEVHFFNVIFNLIDNALKYSPVNPKITLETTNQKNLIVISIQDNGIGISRKATKKIFEKFYRAETGNIHRVKGFGLGLSYVKLIVEQHNGSIKVISKPDKGTLVEIHLPQSSY